MTRKSKPNLMEDFALWTAGEYVARDASGATRIHPRLPSDSLPPMPMNLTPGVRRPLKET